MAAYRAVGGLRNLPFCIAEDFALFNGMWANPDWRVQFVLDKDLIVTSSACPDVRTWWAQRRRWAKDGGKLSTETLAIFSLALIGNVTMVLAPFLLPVREAIAVIAIKWCADLILVWLVMRAADRLSWLRYFCFYEAYLVVLAISTPFMYLTKGVKWKDREIALAESTS